MIYIPTLHRIYHLHRLPLQTPYPAQIAAVGHIMRQLQGARLIVDYTGVGRGIYDMLVDRGLRPFGVTMTGGDEVHHKGDTATVPKSTLISKLTALIHGRELVVPADLPGWPAFRQELESFRNEVTAAGHETWNSRTGMHDDLVIATALCVWGLGDNSLPYGGLMRFIDRQMGQLGGEQYCVGVDLGQAHDPTAICVMSRIDNPSLSDVREEHFRPA